MNYISFDYKTIRLSRN